MPVGARQNGYRCAVAIAGALPRALWPAEAAFASDSAFRTIEIAYPYRDLKWLPGGEIGILITFVLASMLFGFVALKPLGVQI